MRNIIYSVVLFAFLISFSACSNDDSETNVEKVVEVKFDNAQLASSDGLGTFNIIMNDGNVTLNMQMTSIVNSENVLKTGTYSVTRNKNEEYSILSDRYISFWTDKEGTKHIISSGDVSVVSSRESSRMKGLLYDKDGSKLAFSTGDISFSTSESQNVDFTQVLLNDYTLKVDKGEYGIVLANEDRSIGLLLFLYNKPDTNTENPELPSGRYVGTNSGVEGGLFMNNSYWLDAKDGTEHRIKNASCTVEYKSGDAIINGLLEDMSGKKLRFVYNGKLEFGHFRKIDMNLYNSMAGTWTLNSDLWLVYSTSTKSWGEAQTPRSTTKRVMNWIGVPEYGRFYATGLWDANQSGIFISNEGDSFYIPSGYQANPAFIAITSSDNFYVFPSMYDAQNGYYISSGKIPMILSEDGSSFYIPEITQMVVDSDTGEEIEVTYDYFGAIGKGLTHGATTIFSTYSFAHTPTMDHDSSRSSGKELSPQEKRLKAMCSVLLCGGNIQTEKITNKEVEDVISTVSR